jgi:hypothetical protein
MAGYDDVTPVLKIYIPGWYILGTVGTLFSRTE